MDSKHWIFPFQESYDFKLGSSNATNEFWDTLLEENKYHIYKVQEWQIESQEIKFDEFTEEVQKHIPKFQNNQGYDEVNTSSLSNAQESIIKLDSSWENSKNAIVLVSDNFDSQIDGGILEFSKINKVSRSASYNMDDDKNKTNRIEK